MKDYKDSKQVAWAEHHARFNCDHKESSMRRNVILGGGIQYVMQCLTCGHRTSNPRKRDEALSIARGEPADFDVPLKEAWEKLRTDSSEALDERFNRPAFFFAYDEYLATAKWANKRGLVLKRAKNVCEGCAESAAEEVHHLSYANVGNEFLFELVALCHACHERLHAEKVE